jgi:hypothetical protein
MESGIPSASETFLRRRTSKTPMWGPVCRQLREGATADDLVRYLHHVRTALMGLGFQASSALDRSAAERLVEWYADEMRAAEA